MDDEQARTLATAGALLLPVLGVLCGIGITLLIGWPMRRFRWTRGPSVAALPGALFSWALLLAVAATADHHAGLLRLAASVAAVGGFVLARWLYLRSDGKAAASLRSARASPPGPQGG